MKSFIAFLVLALLALVNAVPLAPVDFAAERTNLTARGSPHRKRGIAYNDPNVVKLFDGGGQKTYWVYNWASAPGNTGRAANYEFIPMLHSNRPDHTGPWFANVENCARQGNGPIHVLSFNEPDQCGNGGSCMQDVAATVAEHKKWVEPLRKYGNRMKIASPSVTNGGGAMGLNYLREFLRLCTGCQIDFVTIHWYDSANNVEYFKNHLREAHQLSGKPVWLTEFGPAGNAEQQKWFLRQVLPWMDSQDWVFRYAMFWGAPGFLVNPSNNGLSDVGQVYNFFD